MSLVIWRSPISNRFKVRHDWCETSRMRVTNKPKKNWICTYICTFLQRTRTFRHDPTQYGHTLTYVMGWPSVGAGSAGVGWARMWSLQLRTRHQDPRLSCRAALPTTFHNQVHNISATPHLLELPPQLPLPSLPRRLPLAYYLTTNYLVFPAPPTREATSWPQIFRW